MRSSCGATRAARTTPTLSSTDPTRQLTSPVVDVVDGAGAGDEVVVVVGFGVVGLVVDSVVGGVEVDGVGSTSVVVEVELVVDVVSSSFELSSRPGNEDGCLKLPWDFPLVTARMNLAQMSAGNDPPVTERPCTLSMNRTSVPGAPTYPIHTAAVSFGV